MSYTFTDTDTFEYDVRLSGLNTNDAILYMKPVDVQISINAGKLPPRTVQDDIRIHWTTTTGYWSYVWFNKTYSSDYTDYMDLLNIAAYKETGTLLYDAVRNKRSTNIKLKMYLKSMTVINKTTHTAIDTVYTNPTLTFNAQEQITVPARCLENNLVTGAYSNDIAIDVLDLSKCLPVCCEIVIKETDDVTKQSKTTTVTYYALLHQVPMIEFQHWEVTRTRTLVTNYNHKQMNKYNLVSYKYSYSATLTYLLDGSEYPDTFTYTTSTFKAPYKPATNLGMIYCTYGDRMPTIETGAVQIATQLSRYTFATLNIADDESLVDYNVLASGSYVYDQEDDTLGWNYRVDLSSLVGYGDMNYTVQIIGYEYHDGVTTKVFDSGLLSKAHASYSYSGYVRNISVNDIISTVTFSVYVVYEGTQLNISKVYTNTMSAFMDIFFWSADNTGLGIYTQAEDRMLSTPILNITPDPDLMYLESEFMHPHWMILGAGWYSTGDIRERDMWGDLRQNDDAGFLQWYGNPTEDCDGTCRFMVIQTFLVPNNKMPEFISTHADKPVICGTLGELSTPDDVTVYVNTFMISNKVGVRVYEWEDEINIHPTKGVAHYQIPFIPNKTKGWTYIDEDDLYPSASFCTVANC